MELYDSAWQVASNTKDTLLIARAVLAKGRAYDAINNNPQKTIDYYTEAAQLFSSIPGQRARALHLKHLVAHSYDKVQDSSNCVKILQELYGEILTEPDSLKQEYRFTVEMALISTVVRNYTLADSILQNLTKREWVANDSTEYDYLNHYYVSKVKIDVYQNRRFNSPYLDTLQQLFEKSRNASDSMYYSNELWELNKWMGNKPKVAYYLELNNSIFNRFHTAENLRETRDKLAKIEVAAVESKRQAEAEKAETRKWSIYLLILLLAAITMLTLFLIKRNREIRRGRNEVMNMNQELSQKNLQNELLNKEIHHRVKNNLQMIMSLVYMQENNTNTEEVKENMQNIRLRIESIAKLHQQLIEHSDSVNLQTYIQYLVSNAANVMADNKKVITHLELEPVRVPQKISFPLGLIINEWVTNSVKYAQTGVGLLEISVTILSSGKQLQIHYKDNGKAPASKLVKKSLGLDIVHILIEQLDGTLEPDTLNSYHYTLNIPLSNGQ